MSGKKGSQRVMLVGRGVLTLRESDYVTSGGEGSIYRAHDTVVKIYSDPHKMLRERMADKVTLLSKIVHPSIVAPQGVVTDEGGQPIGFYMPYVSGEPMSRVFVTDFRTRVGFTDDDAQTLVANMRDVVTCAHAHKALMVDANELNWIVEFAKANKKKKSLVVPKVIDVDSWAIGSWPATVIMPSIRDWQAKQFSTETDWFAWGIVSFQVFTGIHPFKGTLDGYKPGELVRRMQEQKSVFTPGVRLPASVRDFSCVPRSLMDWYRSTFQLGERTAPPASFDRAPAHAAQTMRAVIKATGSLSYTKLFGKTGDDVVRVWHSGVALLASGELRDIATNQLLCMIESHDAEVVPTKDGWLIADTQQSSTGIVRTYTHVESGRANSATQLSMPLAAQRIFRAGERLFVVTDTELVELVLRVLGKPVLTTGQRWSIRPHATQWFDGVAIANVLGSMFLYLPLPDGRMVQVRVKELEGLTPVAAKAGNRFVSVMCVDKQGDYKKIECTFDKTYTNYTTWEGRSDTADLNLACVPTGVVATVVRDGELCLFVPTQLAQRGAIKKVVDRGITTAHTLHTWEEKVVYIQGGALWRVSVSQITP